MGDTFHKGDTVRANPRVLDLPLSGWIPGRRPLTEADLEDWRASPASRGFDSAGEPVLPPVGWLYRVEPGVTMTVLRGRCRARLYYGNLTPGLALVRHPTLGDIYVKRSDIERCNAGEDS